MAFWRTLLLTALLYLGILVGCWYGHVLGPVAPGP